ncbi:ABC transporter ATP-binding protein [Mesorhizobium sp. 113-3-9]|uniref:ABC transporter ATP-binding protein n=1 Tax=Mesorhizobium sp. 113-3-9 TaxID=2744517 RepID=UPI001926C923|nr:ABC transporter ATP-binding protein [Mesorhizobium sp. 113-3-9]BCG86979.1 ABC transporter ATP-binding protein [Mesorhizobium sp. 113-3-9]
MILAADALGFSYPGRVSPVFSGIGLDIAAGEVVCVLGPNGVGKSTLLRCLAGLSAPSTGSVLLEGQPIASLSRAAIARLLALVPQSYETVFAFSVRTVVEMGRAPHLSLFDAPGDEAARMTSEALTTLGIAHLIDAAYSEISGGERQLVQIARVLVQAPKLMILDEPTAHLDFANQARFLALIRRLAASGLAVIFTTHAPDHAYALADRTLVMSPRHPPVLGPTGEILTESVLSGAYGVPIRLIRAGGHVACVAEVEPG